MGGKLNLSPFFYMYNKKKNMLPLIADTTSATSTPDFGVFAQLADYGPLGLAVLALGYVAWIFIKRHLAEKDRIQAELNEKKLTPKRKTRK